MSINPRYDERELLVRMASGDEAAFNDFFYRNAPGAFVVIKRLVKEEAVAKDILQEVFIKAWMHRALFMQMEKPSSWLLRTGSNMALNFLRNERNRADIRAAVGHRLSPYAEDADNPVHTKETLQVIQEAITLLPEQRRKIYQLSREQGFDRTDIALKLGISENTVKNQLVIALKFIRDHLAAKGIHFLTILALTEYLFFEETVR